MTVLFRLCNTSTHLMHFDETAFATQNIFLFNFTDRSAFFKFLLLAVEFAFLTLHS